MIDDLLHCEAGVAVDRGNVVDLGVTCQHVERRTRTTLTMIGERLVAEGRAKQDDCVDLPLICVQQRSDMVEVLWWAT